MSYFGNHFQNYGGGWWGSVSEVVIYLLRGVYQLSKYLFSSFALSKILYGDYADEKIFAGYYTGNLIILRGEYQPTKQFSGVYE